MSLQTTLLLSSALLAAATPQWGGPPGSNGGAWGAGGPFAAFPSCASSCRPANTDWSDSAALCSDTTTLNTLSTCVDGTSCSDSDKSDIEEAIAQLCVNAGTSVTVSPWNTYSVTSGGSAWPTAWTTNSAWASAVSAWSGSVGWSGGPNGPFGGPLGNGGPWSSGPWESGAWTEWWGTNACPPSTWSGWTAGPWGTSAPWTSWTACSATATASTVYEITTTNAAGSQITSASTSYGYRVAEAANTASETTTSTDSGALPTNLALIGSAAGAIGVFAGAVLL